MRVRENAKTLTSRPSSPVVDAQVAPPSRLASAPEPRVPASTSRLLKGLKAIAVKTALPLCTEVQVVPPSVLLNSEPSELPTITAWLFDGSTARAKTAVRPWCGSGFSATHVESGRASAWTAAAASTTTQTAASVATRRWPGSDTSLPIITQAGTRAGEASGSSPGPVCLQSVRAGSQRPPRPESEASGVVDRPRGGLARSRRLQTGVAARRPGHRDRADPARNGWADHVQVPGLRDAVGRPGHRHGRPARGPLALAAPQPAHPCEPANRFGVRSRFGRRGSRPHHVDRDLAARRDPRV